MQPVLDLQSSSSLKTAFDLSQMMNMPAPFQGKETCPGLILDEYAGCTHALLTCYNMGFCRDDWITRGIDSNGNDVLHMRICVQTLPHAFVQTLLCSYPRQDQKDRHMSVFGTYHQAE